MKNLDERLRKLERTNADKGGVCMIEKTADGFDGWLDRFNGTTFKERITVHGKTVEETEAKLNRLLDKFRITMNCPIIVDDIGGYDE